jgi:hypothetical protein
MAVISLARMGGGERKKCNKRNRKEQKEQACFQLKKRRGKRLHARIREKEGKRGELVTQGKRRINQLISVREEEAYFHERRGGKEK